MTSGPDWVRLGRHIVARRVALGMGSTRMLAEKTVEVSPPRGISLRTLGKLELGQTDAYPATLAVLEIALQWEIGSATDVLHGQEPRSSATTAPDPGRTADPSYRDILRSEHLTEGEKLAAIDAIEQRRARIRDAGFTEDEQQALRNAPRAFKILVDRKRARDQGDGDAADGESALGRLPGCGSGDRPA